MTQRRHGSVLPALQAGMLLALVAAGCAYTPKEAQAQGSIYTCTDAQGRRLTSDRPMIECLDREQREMTPSGTLRRTLKPPMTAAERQAQEEQERREAVERARQQEERMRLRALLARFPDLQALERERAASQTTLEDVIGAVNRRMAELLSERRRLETESEFYKSNPARTPPQLRRALDDNRQQMTAQQRFLEGQQGERERIQRQFTEMQRQLEPVWAAQRRADAAPAATR